MSLSASESQSLINHPLYSQFINEVSQDTDVLAVYHYGSSRNQMNYRDIDLCIIANEEDPGNFLKKFLKLSGTYAALGSIPLDITLFSLIPLYIKIQVIRDGYLVFIRDEDTLFALIRKTNRQWEDFEPSYRILIE